jgi:hypothetical protein
MLPGRGRSLLSFFMAFFSFFFLFFCLTFRFVLDKAQQLRMKKYKNELVGSIKEGKPYAPVASLLSIFWFLFLFFSSNLHTDQDPLEPLERLEAYV